jgi:hypothetical protein
MKNLKIKHAKKICSLLEVKFKKFITQSQKVTVFEVNCGETFGRSEVTIERTGKILLTVHPQRIGPVNVEINTLPIIDYLRGEGFVFKY